MFLKTVAMSDVIPFPVFCFSSGGVVLASRDGKIVFENSLDARLEVVFRKKLPEVLHIDFL